MTNSHKYILHAKSETSSSMGEVRLDNTAHADIDQVGTNIMITQTKMGSPGTSWSRISENIVSNIHWKEAEWRADQDGIRKQLAK